MTHDTKAKPFDGDKAAKIIRNVAQIDADATLLIEALSEHMMEEATRVVAKSIKQPWMVVDTDWTPRIVYPAWKMAKGVGTGDAWLELTEIGPDDAEGLSWISVAAGVGPTRMGLELVFRRGLQDVAKAAIFDNKVVAPLLKCGMIRQEDVWRVYFPVAVQPELLAQAFTTNDFDKALAPVGQAVIRALECKADLDRIVAHVRSAGARG